MLEFQLEYAAVGGNRHPSAADWDNTSDYLAYGAGQNIALWSPLKLGHLGVECLLRGHTDTVNAIKFFLSDGGPRLLLSGSADKSVRVWQIDLVRLVQSKPVAILEGHNSSVNCLAVCPGSDRVVSGSADATINIWRLVSRDHSLDFEISQTFHIAPRFFPLTLALHRLSSSNDLVLAIAGTNSIVQIYVTSADGQFDLQATLPGHEGWIRALSITRECDSAESDLLLASASQDKYIRIWRVAKREHCKPDPNNVLEALKESLSNKSYDLQASETTYSLNFEALLLGHEDWIYTVRWHLIGSTLQLLSASADNSVAVWACEKSSGVWICITRLGEISSQKGSTTATGSAGGFWIGLWSPNGESIVSLGRTGSWRLWSYDRDRDQWVQGVGISGHTKSVRSLSWSKAGTNILSTGSDQTTRLYAEWKRGANCSWHEMARPQIHGYDLNCIDSISDTQFISGADEKLLRVFDEPRATADLLDNICGTETNSKQGLPHAANMPVLGLSNKTLESPDDGNADDRGEKISEDDALDSEPINNGQSFVSDRPPHEDELAKHTLWPEREKLYGHGYEISAVAASQDGSVVATSCKASSVEHAVIRLYGTQDWREVRPVLIAHSLTATALRFSKNDQFLLSVGRDRQWAIFEKGIAGSGTYTLKHSDPKGHSKMILDAGWAPTEAGVVFTTAGRDKMVKIWEKVQEAAQCRLAVTTAHSVTAVDIAPRLVDDCLLLAAGTETGQVFFYYINILKWNIKHSFELSNSLRPSRSLTRLAWRPLPTTQEASNGNEGSGSHKYLHLAVASEDSSLRLFRVTPTVTSNSTTA